MEQICKKCNVLKSIEDFYTHPQMGNGHLSFCKECIKERVRERSRSEIGRKYDYIRNQSPKRKKWLIGYQKRKRTVHNLAYKANNIVGQAVRVGTIIKPTTCSDCGILCSPHGHHEDYKKPLEVIWLCGSCHRKRHAQYKRKY